MDCFAYVGLRPLAMTRGGEDLREVCRGALLFLWKKEQNGGLFVDSGGGAG
ncbi:MAG: hypothetical protein J6C85_05575 [Alphaproteobacteria bacterium]|nr:hypothetical protein [Alphaproteobacteria bacterium]